MESSPQEHSARDDFPGSTAPPSDGELPDFRPAQAANDVRMSRLARTIEQEIIPRLMLAHRTAAGPQLSQVGPAHAVSFDDIEQFARLVLSHDEDATLAAIHSLHAREVSIDRIFLDLLAPTARYLGKLWDDDLCTFTDVTVGLGRLQRVLRELSPAFGRNVAHPARGRRVLLLPGPGEQHTFGLVMVSEFFRRAGWDVTGGAWAADADVSALVRAEWFDVVGFSLGAEIHLQALADRISAVRHTACNRELKVLVGGPLFGIHPEFMARVGADGMTIDGREAPLLAEGLIGRQGRRHGSSG